MSAADVVPTYQPEHGHPGRQQLRAPAVRPLRPRRRRRWPSAMAGFRSSGTLAVGADALGRARELFDAGALDEDEARWRTIADCRCALPARLVDPHTAVGYAAAGQQPSARRRACRWSRWRPRIPPSSRMRSRRRPAMRPPLPPRLADLMRAHRALSTCCPTTSSSGLSRSHGARDPRSRHGTA